MGQKNQYRVLIIGDGELADSLSKLVTAVGLLPIPALSGKEGASALKEGAPDAIVLAMPLAGEDGPALCMQIRSESAVPLLAFTAARAEDDCVGLFRAGADDYVAAPYSQDEFEARILAAIRRSNSEPYRPWRIGAQPPLEGVLQVGKIRLDLTTCRVNVDGIIKTLTPNEFRLMAIFLRAPGEVFTREDLRKRVWPDDQHSLHLVEVHIANLRSKIEADPHHPNYIVTVRSRGYKLAMPS